MTPYRWALALVAVQAAALVWLCGAIFDRLPTVTQLAALFDTEEAV